MSFALISSTSNGATGGGATSVTAPNAGTISTTGADLIVALVSNYTGTPEAADLTDGGLNSYTLEVSQTAGGDALLRCVAFYKLNPATSGTHAFSFSRGGATSSPAIVVLAFSGLAGSPTVAHASSGAGFTSAQAGAIGSTNDLVVAAIAWYTNNTMAIDSSFSSPIEVGYSAGNHVGVAASWKEVSGSVNPTWSWSGSNVLATVSLSFTGSGGGGGSSFLSRGTLLGAG